MGIISSFFGPSKADYKTLLSFQQWFLDYNNSNNFIKSRSGTSLLVQSFAIVNEVQPTLPLYASLLMKHKKISSREIIDNILLPELEFLSTADFDNYMLEPARVVGAALLIQIYDRDPDSFKKW
ncbi:hypothetical protein [Pectobacterium odoriferum]|uniref:hypothetical protein n=1 Tax=Pectobacterium odoriferum TaxID=78398 RepID=UPI001CF55662|nr:hypothetical protein [Pectobacterium odoriferum]MCA6960996.1 hypothetical protein [Pectobacterium odoriferum]MCH5009107.1 hypothetical protein [Pectobacterium odoriferum]